MSSEGKDEAERRFASPVWFSRLRREGGGAEGRRCSATSGGSKRLRPTLLALSGSLGVHLLLIAVALSLLVSAPQPEELLHVTLLPGGGSGGAAKAGGGAQVNGPAAKPLPHPVAETRPSATEAKSMRHERPRHVEGVHRRARVAAKPVAVGKRADLAKKNGPEVARDTANVTGAVGKGVTAAVTEAAEGSSSGAGMGRGIGRGLGDGVDERNNCVYCPAPRYPLMARWRGWQGTVSVGIVVRPDGRVDAVRVRRSSGYEALDRAAIEVARISRFSPARERGGVASLRGWIGYRFVLRRASVGSD